MWQRAENNLQV